MLEATKLTNNQLMEIWREESLFDEDGAVLFEVVEESEWQDEGKFSSIEVIFTDVIAGKHYLINIYRSGSYFSYYEYEVWDKPIEVKKVTETIEITKWVGV